MVALLSAPAVKISGIEVVCDGQVALFLTEDASFDEVEAWAQRQLNVFLNWSVEQSYQNLPAQAEHGISPYNRQQITRLIHEFPYFGQGRAAFILPYSPRSFLMQTYVNTPRREPGQAWDRQIFFSREEAMNWLKTAAYHLR